MASLFDVVTRCLERKANALVIIVLSLQFTLSMQTRVSCEHNINERQTTMACPKRSNDRGSGNGNACPSRQTKKRKLSVNDPVSFVFHEFNVSDYDTNEIIKETHHRFIEPTPKMIEAYSETSRAVRDLDLTKLKELHKAGVPMLCSNRFGDNLVSIAARRGATNIVKFLVDEAKTTLFIRDDTQRTVLHDALWTPEPNFDVVETLLKVAPELCLLKDKRGATPFDYIRPDHTEQWMEWLDKNRSLLQPKSNTKAKQPNSKNPAAA